MLKRHYRSLYVVKQFVQKNSYRPRDRHSFHHTCIERWIQVCQSNLALSRSRLRNQLVFTEIERSSGDSHGCHWRHWRQDSTSPMTARAVNLTFLCWWPLMRMTSYGIPSLYQCNLRWVCLIDSDSIMRYTNSLVWPANTPKCWLT